MGQRLRRDTAARVLHGQPPEFARVGAAQVDRAVLRPGVPCIQRQIAHKVRQQHPVRQHNGLRGRVAVQHHIRQTAHGIGKGRGHPHGAQHHAVRLQAVQRQKLLAQTLQPCGLMVEGLRRRAPSFRIQRAAAQQVGVADQAGQRRFQLVGQVGHKAALAGVQLL